MTRRELTQPTEEVESQSGGADTPESASTPASTLPTYEDAIQHTSPSAWKWSKSRFGRKFGATGTGGDKGGSLRQVAVSTGWKAVWRLLFILGIVLLYNLVALSLFSHSESGENSSPPAPPALLEPETDGSLWPSPREIRVHEVTSAIHGTYPLYDLLELSTVTGAIHVTIEPKPGNGAAVIRMKTKTGAIDVRFARPGFLDSNGQSGKSSEKGIYERVYNTEMHTVTGQIDAEVLHGGAGGEIVITSKTGKIDLRVTPISDQPSRIETTTMTGQNKVTVVNPIQGTTLKNLTALHRSRTTGTLDVDYPREWEGRVHAWCRGTGSVDVQGDGLEFQGGGKDVYAFRGQDASRNGKIIEVVSDGTGWVTFRA